MAVAEVGAGARAEIMAKVGAGAENNFGSATLIFTIIIFLIFFRFRQQRRLINCMKQKIRCAIYGC